MQGQPLYRAHIIVADDRPSNDFPGMSGDIHAYSDPDSNSGHLVTVARLLELGERPEQFSARTFSTFGHRNVVRAAERRLAQREHYVGLGRLAGGLAHEVNHLLGGLLNTVNTMRTMR